MRGKQILKCMATVFCLRRIETQHPFEHFRTETTTTYIPVMESEINESQLRFKE